MIKKKRYMTAVQVGRSGNVGLFLDEETADRKSYTLRSITMEEVEKLYETNVQPPITLNKTAAQGLMDSLWDCGLRPSEGFGSAGCLAAIQRHLEDMRTLIFSTG